MQWRRVSSKTSKSSESPNVKAAPGSSWWHGSPVKGMLSRKERAVRKVRKTSKGSRSWVERGMLWGLNGRQSLPHFFHSLWTSSLCRAGSILIHVANRWNTLKVTIGQKPILGNICSMRSTILSGMFFWGPRSGSFWCVVGSKRSLVPSKCPLNSCVGPRRSKIWSRRSTMTMVLGDHPLPYLLQSPTWNMQI